MPVAASLFDRHVPMYMDQLAAWHLRVNLFKEEPARMVSPVSPDAVHQRAFIYAAGAVGKAVQEAGLSCLGKHAAGHTALQPRRMLRCHCCEPQV